MSSKKGSKIPDDWARIAGEAGAQAAMERVDKERVRFKKEAVDRRLRNTKLLLRNYRSLMDHCTSAIFDINQIQETDSAMDILDSLDTPGFDEDMYVESIKRTAERTYIMMTHVNEMLRLYEIFCAESPKEEDRRRYQTLHDLYLAEKTKTAREIADEQNMDTRTVYRDVDAAVEKLSALLFGIYGLNVTR